MLSLLLCAGCGEGAGGEADAALADGGGLSPADFARESARLHCEEVLRCESRYGASTVDIFESICHPSARESSGNEQLRAVERGRARFDEAAAAACLTELAALTCPRGQPTEVPACARVFTGLVPLGEACSVGSLDKSGGLECVVGAVCNIRSSCPGRCELPRNSGGDLGAPCDVGNPCDLDHHCREGICGALLVVGEGCESHGDCFFSNLICGPSTGGMNVCVDPYAATAAGGACVGFSFLSDTCPVELVCVCDECTIAGTCVIPAPLGAPCNSTTPCGLSARCVEGSCRPIAASEGDCSRGAVCPLTHICDGAVCRPLPTYGEPCTDRCFGAACLVDGDVCGFLGGLKAEGEMCSASLRDCADGLACLLGEDVMYRCYSGC